MEGYRCFFEPGCIDSIGGEAAQLTQSKNNIPATVSDGDMLLVCQEGEFLGRQLRFPGTVSSTRLFAGDITVVDAAVVELAAVLGVVCGCKGALLDT